ncbi:MAG: hypothetical protein ACLSFK_07595 [Streptococcus salivarius]
MELVLLRQRGKLLTGRQTIDGVQLYFDKNGKQVKGSLVEIDGKTYYFDKDSGAMWTNTTLEKTARLISSMKMVWLLRK